jgi:hypothetical protein
VILVEVRCKVRGCGKVLDEVEWAPAETDEDRWTAMVYVHLCPRHGGANGSVAAWVEKRRRAGLPHDRYAIGRYLPWDELRPAVQRARLYNDTQTYFV